MLQVHLAIGRSDDVSVFIVGGAVSNDVVAGLEGPAFALHDFCNIEVIIVASYVSVSCSSLDHSRESLTTQISQTFGRTGRWRYVVCKCEIRLTALYALLPALRPSLP